MPRQGNTCRAVVAELRAQGIPVREEPGWEGRGSATFSPRGLVVHHTADGPGEYPSLRIVRDGRSGLPGPLAQWGLGRSGTVILIAAGRANHAGAGGWRGLSGNSSVWGIEAESTGKGDWTAAQRANYPKLAAALARHQPFPVDAICAHREWAPNRKPDPTGIDMPSFRAEVARLLAGQPVTPPPSPIEEDDDMQTIDVQPGQRKVYWLEPTTNEKAEHGTGFLGVKEVLVVLSTHGKREIPMDVWFNAVGGPGKFPLKGAHPYVRKLTNSPAGWLYVENLGTDPLDVVGGSIMLLR